MQPLIDMLNIDLTRNNQRVFSKLNLSIESGQHTAIIGPNGAGKSSVFKLLSRELYPKVQANSHFKFKGQALIDLWKLREEIGFVSHDYQERYETLSTGLEVVLSAFYGSVGKHNHHEYTAQQRQLAMDALAAVDLSACADSPFLRLSTGQKRRLLLARAMVNSPEVLALDEPTTGLDLRAQFMLLSHMRNFAREQGTLILTTHHFSEIVPEINRIVLMKDCKIIADGPKNEIMCDETLSDLYETKLMVRQSDGYYHALPRG